MFCSLVLCLCFILGCVLWSAVVFREFVFVIDLVVLCCCPLFMCSLVLLVVIALWYCGTSVRKYFMFSAIDYAGCS